ncbi:MAG: hypothetical protein KME21_14715 [Desmonostoc vinosum HA7617-LM4]|nr:hypothetical protein [Desmonostoc vinosum HA7617-LM4]
MTLRVDGLTENVNNLTLRVDGLTENVNNLTLRVDGLTENVNNLTEESSSIIDIMMHSIQNAETDRETFQAEIQRIWEYLVRQGGNGSNSST